MPAERDVAAAGRPASRLVRPLAAALALLVCATCVPSRSGGAAAVPAALRDGAAETGTQPASRDPESQDPAADEPTAFREPLVDLDGEAVLRGRFALGGRPAAGWTVGPQVSLDAEGRFVLVSRSAGRAELTLIPDPPVGLVFIARLELVPGEQAWATTRRDLP